MDLDRKTGGTLSNKGKFHVNTSLIEKVNKDDQALELQGLDVSVYDQATLEQGIIAQVDEALKVELQEEGEIIEEDCTSPASETLKERDFAVPSTSSLDSSCILEKYLTTQAKLEETWKDKTPVKKRVDQKKKKPPDEAKTHSRKTGKPSQTKTKKRKSEKSGKSVSAQKPDNCPEDSEDEWLSDHSEYVPSSSDLDSDCSEYTPEAAEKKDRTPCKKRKVTKVLNDSDSEHVDGRKRERKEADDGNIDAYHRRLERWADRDVFANSFHEVGGYKCPNTIWDNLYPYQRKGVEWLLDLDSKPCGGILGDEMGLGKTIQVIAFLATIDYTRSHRSGFTGLGPSLIVCPTTVMHQWVREFHTWFPPMRVAILHESGNFGSKDRSKLISTLHSRNKGIIITSYTGMVQNKESLLCRKWHYVILDEGHKIRNAEAKVTLVAKEIDTPHRLILSGSPMQNNLRELWSLFDFIYPGKLGTLQVFMANFAVPITEGGYVNASQTQVVTSYKCALTLRNLISPYLLRRQKCEVGATADLPGKTEQVLFCKLSEEQRFLYKKYLENLSFDEIIQGKTKFFMALITLRKICNHPDLYTGRSMTKKKLLSSSEQNDNSYGYFMKAGKMIVIDTLLRVWKGQGHRVLVFTQGKMMLYILEAFIKRKGYKYLRLDGGTSIAARQPMIDKFNKDDSYFVMLLTTRVGGLGVNLTGADRVVIYDPDWNPATDTQARERAWRIGQKNDVTIYRLITSGTIEEKIYHRQIYKQFLSNKVLKDPKQRRFFKSNDIMELFSLSETIEGGTTETAAIFAGTGSEITRDTESVRKATKSVDKVCTEKINFTPDQIEEMKRKASELSKKFFLLKAVATTSSSASQSKEESDPVYGPDGNLLPNCLKKEENNNKVEEAAIDKPSEEAEIDKPSEEAAIDKPSSSHSNVIKSDKRTKPKHRKRKGSHLEGVEVPHLVKSKKAKVVTVKHNASQNDYVLKKLFSKSGIEVAMQHDNIMGGGPSDYTVVEAEAEKVAQRALEALRQSRTEITNYKTPLFRTGAKTGATSLNGSTTSSLLTRFRERNLDSEVSYEGNLLKEMISWLSSQGGTATTDQLVSEFQSKVQGVKSPLFKSLLKNVAQFYRGPDKVGYWSLRDQFK